MTIRLDSLKPMKNSLNCNTSWRSSAQKTGSCARLQPSGGSATLANSLHIPYSTAKRYWHQLKSQLRRGLEGA